MKRSKSGAQKRKEAATARDAVAKLPKMTEFFKITEQSRPGTSGVATYWLMWLKPRAAGWWGRQNVMIFLF